jgi:hypothetical protein
MKPASPKIDLDRMVSPYTDRINGHVVARKAQRSTNLEQSGLIQPQPSKKLQGAAFAGFPYPKRN